MPRLGLRASPSGCSSGWELGMEREEMLTAVLAMSFPWALQPPETQSCLLFSNCSLFAQQIAQLIPAGVSGNIHGTNYWEGSVVRENVLQRDQINQCFVWSAAHSATVLLSHIPIQPLVILLTGKVTSLFWNFYLKARSIKCIFLMVSYNLPPRPVDWKWNDIVIFLLLFFKVKKKKEWQTSLFK